MQLDQNPRYGVGQELDLGLASLLYDNEDNNAGMVKVGLPTGDANNVPVMMVGIESAISGQDLGILNGETEPQFVMTNSTAAKYMKYGWNGVYFTFAGKDVTNQVYYQIPITFGSTYLLAPDVDQVFGNTARQGSNDTIGTRDMRFGLHEITTGDFYPFVLVAGNRNQDVPFNYGYDTDPVMVYTSRTAFTTSTNEWTAFKQTPSHFNVDVNTGVFQVTTSIATNRVTVNDQDYSITVQDGVVAYTAMTAQRTATLPLAADVPAGTEITVKDESGGASSNNIVVDGNGAETIDGAANITITADYGQVTVYSDGSSAWFTKG